MQVIRFYNTIDKIRLSSFISCIVNDNLSALIISGYPQNDIKINQLESELKTVWSNIHAQYLNQFAALEERLYIEKLKEVTILKITIDLLKCSIDLLNVIYDAGFADEVNRILKQNFKFNWQDQKTYHLEFWMDQLCRERLRGPSLPV